MHAKPYLWSTANHSIAKVQPQIKTNVQSRVTSVSITRCGNFGILGFANGVIVKFNMQSGKERGVFTLDHKSPVGETIHKAEVTGLCIDNLNRYLVSSSKDRSIKLWDFYRCKLLKSYQTDFPINNLCYSPVSDLIAFSGNDLSMTILNP